MRVKEFSIKHRFLVVTILAFAIIGPLVYTITQYQVRNFIIDTSRKSFQEEVQAKANRFFNLNLANSLKSSDQVYAFAEQLKTETAALNIKVIDPNGVVIFSDSKSEVSQNYSDIGQVKDALAGKLGDSDLSLDDGTEVTYIPIVSGDNDVRGVLVAKIKLGSALKFVNELTLTLEGIIGVILIGFALAVYFVFASAEADMNEKDHALVDQSKAFEEEKQLDEAIMTSIAESLVVINKDGQIMFFNPETEKLTGYQADTVEYRLYRKILLFVDKDGQEQKRNPIAESLKSAAPIDIGIKEGFFLKNSRKELIPVSISIAPILNADKKVQGVAVTMQDVSIEKELDAVKDEFVYVVAHELGNPIFALDGYLSILEDQSKGASQATKEMISSARNVNSQLSELVNDLLEVTRNEQGRLEFELTPTDLDPIIELVIKNAQFKAKSKKITITYQKSKFPKVMANEQKIKEVLTNLIDNAIKYTPEGGKVTITQEKKNDQVYTHITDNGFGIKKADQEKLFTKFYRVRTNETANITGTGLGLFICRQIIEKCGGQVDFVSEEGKGSTFSIALQIKK